ncbi:putative tyrosine-protein phosphatase TPTE [Echinops telfairi]|uniref:Tyrosine-protein phosphatase TPTE n=1 Tax=Echinops telfairi TaxID=9371 RepID=A0AC55CU35_ECHTE|nr:putative tyrosine-protein phosphatase TPTE [Echinops telfairi]
MDVLLRIYVEGVRHYFSDILNSLDAFVMGVILLINIVYTFYNFHDHSDIPSISDGKRGPASKLGKHFHLPLVFLYVEAVSGNKRRYNKDGFDLDLTYVTERIIAMSFPSSGKQSFYRNPIKEVVRFLDTKHLDHYMIYNLCSERGYDPKHFHNRVRRIMIDDHNVPPLSEMVKFTQEVTQWLAEDEDNVVVIHCKGGKGRTGTMVCACLIACEIFTTAEESLYFFGERRTDKTTSSKFQGVETPSQSRYVGYFAKVKHDYHGALPPENSLFIKSIVIHAIHGSDGSGICGGGALPLSLTPFLSTVGKPQQKGLYAAGGEAAVGQASSFVKKHEVGYSTIHYHRSLNVNGSFEIDLSVISKEEAPMYHDAEADRVIIKLNSCPSLNDDVKIRFLSSSDLPRYYDNCPFFFWFHTRFIENHRLYLPRNELDNLHKRKTWKIYRPEFAVEIFFG